ncbi:hypothetical protein G6F56_009321 [Rhizopus delemar]|nr:hypothetical protein G6F56_009321 [Rhizopus delemar]
MLANTVIMIMYNQKIFPEKLSTLRKHVGIDFTYNHMRRFIVCPLCHSLYTQDQANSLVICRSIEFGAICGATLMEVVGGKKEYVGKVAAFNSIKQTLAMMFSRPGFEVLIESWRSRTRHQDTMYDIHDGQLWSEFKDKNGQVFIEQERSLLFTLNVDWFQSSKQSPGPKEPDTSQIHKYLQVMVDELNELYYGEFYKLPCNKCSSDFPGRKDIKTHRDFVPSLSSCSTWVLRINETNRQQASNWKTATSQRERIDLEMKFGTRFSALHNLAYFDVVRCTSVDPMHNLFLGTAKKMVHIWRRLPALHKENWALFVQACQLLCSLSITFSDANDAHELLRLFALGVAKLYGEGNVTPNMHMHLHILEAVRDFGPIYSFWVYAFERLNGDIKKMSVNYKSSFEVTYMRKFLQTVHYGDYIRNLPPSIKQYSLMMKMVEYLSPMASDPLAAKSDASISLFDFNTFVSAPYSNDLITDGESLPPNTIFSSQSKYTLTKEEYNALVSFYDQVYPSRVFSNALDFDYFQFGSTIIVPEVYQFASIQLLGQTYTSKKSRTSHGSYIEIM